MKQRINFIIKTSETTRNSTVDVQFLRIDAIMIRTAYLMASTDRAFPSNSEHVRANYT